VDDSRSEQRSRVRLVAALADSLKELAVEGDPEAAEVALDALRRLACLPKRSEPPDHTTRVTPLRPVEKGT
jgi:hypothetical protein